MLFRNLSNVKMTHRQIAPGDFAIIDIPGVRLANSKYIIRKISAEGIFIAPNTKADCSLLIHTVNGWQVYQYNQPHRVTFEAKPTLTVQDLLDKDYYTIQYKCKINPSLKQVWSDQDFWYQKVGRDYGQKIRAHKPNHESYLQQYEYLHNTTALERNVYPRIDGLMLNLRMGYSLSLVSAKEALECGNTEVVNWLKEHGVYTAESVDKEESNIIHTSTIEENNGWLPYMKSMFSFG